MIKLVRSSLYIFTCHIFLTLFVLPFFCYFFPSSFPPYFIVLLYSFRFCIITIFSLHFPFPHTVYYFPFLNPLFSSQFSLRFIPLSFQSQFLLFPSIYTSTLSLPTIFSLHNIRHFLHIFPPRFFHLYFPRTTHFSAISQTQLFSLFYRGSVLFLLCVTRNIILTLLCITFVSVFIRNIDSLISHHSSVHLFIYIFLKLYEYLLLVFIWFCDCCVICCCYYHCSCYCCSCCCSSNGFVALLLVIYMVLEEVVIIIMIV